MPFKEIGYNFPNVLSLQGNEKFNWLISSVYIDWVGNLIFTCMKKRKVALQEIVANNTIKSLNGAPKIK